MMINQYLVRRGIYFLITIIISIISSVNISAGTIVEFIGEKIPQKYYVGNQYYFYQTDSLYLNNSLLVRDIDYIYIKSINSFDLSTLKITPNDTLRIRYTLLPAWLKTKFGREIPSTNSTNHLSVKPNYENDKKIINNYYSDIDISGAKSFRFNTASTVGSNFSQTLDLSIAGNLTKQLEIKGTISDRGYNPSYGTANSRLNELDKINLLIKSDNFKGNIGDILYQDRFSTAIQRDKRISGVSVAFQNIDYDFHATASRPRGQYQTIKLSCIDQLQGPYQINANGGPVVPGSEQVWLDGNLLERGTNKDYLIDYSIGSVIFNVNHPIDRRSRIEIDYEPQANDFKGELFSGGGAVSFGDSSVIVAIEWLREGDDSNQPLTGELSNLEKSLLEDVGDNIEQAFRSGVTEDTNGSYILILDSLPDSVFKYIEQDTGDYSINFSYIGEGKGDYSFSGNNTYQFKGIGKGDYLPIIIIPVAQRTDQYLAKININNNILGNVFAEIRKSDHDKNLFSDLNDNDNSGEMYSLSLKRNWREQYKRNYYNLSIRQKDINYQSRSRIYNTDFSREFLLPTNFIAVTDESWYRFESGFSLSKRIRINPFISHLSYKNSLDSWRTGTSIIIKPHKTINTHFVCDFVRVDYDQEFGKTEGEVNKYSSGLKWDIEKKWKLNTGIEYDRRINTYTGTGQGTRFLKFTAEIDHISEKLKYERFDEDSLSGNWSPSLLRQLLSFESKRQLGKLNYTSIVSYQWLKESETKEQNILGQMNLRYNNILKRLSFNMAYVYSNETRRVRGISYLKVESGGGNYIFEDGEYRPDPDGDYIKVEEILSEQAKVSRGEKVFNLTKGWDIAVFRFDSRIHEELLDGEKRSALWVIPFFTDNDNAYLFYNHHYNINFKLFPIRSFYAVTLGFTEDQEIRNIAGSQREKRNRSGIVTLKQALSKTLLEESLELFNKTQDEYYNRAGDIDGFSAKVSARQPVNLHELKLELKYRQAESKIDDRSKTYSIISTSRWNLFKQGQIRSSLEFYSQTLSNINSSAASYILTDNKTGSKGVIWFLNLRYGVSKSIKINFNISGRHSDNRTARVTARGEMVAGF